MTGKRRKPHSLSPARKSAALLVHINPHHVGLFRFLLEAEDNLALFTVLDPRLATLKLLFSPHQEDRLRHVLETMRGTVPFEVASWPWA